MANLIPTGYYHKRILCLQRPINIFSGVFRSEKKSLRRCAGLDCLIPDCQYTAVSLSVSENRVSIINARINNHQDYPLPCQIQRFPLDLCNAADDQTVWIKAHRSLFLHQPIHFWYTLIIVKIFTCISDIIFTHIHQKKIFYSMKTAVKLFTFQQINRIVRNNIKIIIR